jgi:5-methylcytosine-specific restriction endonuclease McrA
VDKQCTLCHKILPIAMFGIHIFRGKNSCIRSRCKSCESIKAKEYYKDHLEESRSKARIRASQEKESIKEYMKKYRAENRDAILQYTKDYYYDHRDHYLEKMAEYRSLNKEEMNAYKRKFYLENRDVLRKKWKQFYTTMPPLDKEAYLIQRREYYAKNDEKMKEYHRKWCLENKDISLLHQNKRRALRIGLCEDFSKDDILRIREIFNDSCANCGATENLEIDHHYPISKGHPLSKTNAVLLCSKCNRKKHTKVPESFYQPEKLKEIEGKLLGRASAW